MSYKLNLIIIIFYFYLSNDLHAQIKTLTISGDGYFKRELHKKNFNKSLNEIRKIASDSRKNKFILRNWNLNIKDSIISLQLFPTDEDFINFGDTVFNYKYKINNVETTISRDGHERYDWYAAKNICHECDEEVVILRYELSETVGVVSSTGSRDVKTISGYIVFARYNHKLNPELVRLNYE